MEFRISDIIPNLQFYNAHANSLHKMAVATDLTRDKLRWLYTSAAVELAWPVASKEASQENTVTIYFYNKWNTKPSQLLALESRFPKCKAVVPTTALASFMVAKERTGVTIILQVPGFPEQGHLQDGS